MIKEQDLPLVSPSVMIPFNLFDCVKRRSILTSGGHIVGFSGCFSRTWDVLNYLAFIVKNDTRRKCQARSLLSFSERSVIDTLSAVPGPLLDHV